MSPLASIKASLWGNLAMWTGFLVLYTGHIFGQAYRSTGLLEILLDSVQSILPSSDQKGRAVALVAIVGGFIGAFNGFATYPVTIPGLVELGFDGVYACSSYLVYFSWTLPFNSLFIAPNISNAASHVPVVDIARVAGLLEHSACFPLPVGLLESSEVPFFRLGLPDPILARGGQQYRGHHPFHAGLAGLLHCDADRRSDDVACRALPVRARREAAVSPERCGLSAPGIPRAPLFRIHALQSLRTADPGRADRGSEPSAEHRRRTRPLSVQRRRLGIRPVAINIVTTAGFFIFITALVCYLFRSKDANPAKDFVTASRRSSRSLATLAVGSANRFI